MIIVSTFISWGKQSGLRLFNHIIICMFCICSAAEFRAAFIEDSFFFFPYKPCIYRRGRLVHTHYVAFLLTCQPALLFGQAKRATWENSQASGEAARHLSLPLPHFRISSPASTFHDIPQWRACLQATFLLTFIFSFQLPAAVGEAPTFGFTEHMANKFFKPEGVRS